MSKGESKEYRTRLKEITSVLHKYGITRGITPQKLRMILEDLGPTYINRSDYVTAFRHFTEKIL